jgi:hypothetical protein
MLAYLFREDVVFKELETCYTPQKAPLKTLLTYIAARVPISVLGLESLSFHCGPFELRRNIERTPGVLPVELETIYAAQNFSCCR